jgi:hypothetical protein
VGGYVNALVAPGRAHWLARWLIRGPDHEHTGARAGADRDAPTRKVWIGSRVISKLEQGNPGLPGERLVAIVRRVLWPDPRYEPAGEFQASSPDGEGSRS